MSVVRYDPFSLLDLHRFLESPFARWTEEPFPSLAQWTPSVDIKTEDKRYLVLVDVPGVEPDKIEVFVEGNALVIKGERHTETEEKKEGYSRIERRSGSFYRSFTLPADAEGDKISAKTKNGVLEIEIPKKKQAEAKRIKIKEKE
jgi:HSP20 family protein